MMLSRISKWGNSLGVRIPRSIAQQARLVEGTPVEILVRHSEIVVRSTRWDLDDLLERITPENCHAATEWGSVQGQEWE